MSEAGLTLTKLIARCLPPHCAVFNATFLVMDSVEDSATASIQETAAICEARIQYLQRLIDNESVPTEQQLRIVDLDES